MKLKELKASTLYQSSDLDDMEIMLCVTRNGKQQYEPLCFAGWVPMKDNPEASFVVLGGLTEIHRMVESGEMKKPKGYIAPETDNGFIDTDDSPTST